MNPSCETCKWLKYSKMGGYHFYSTSGNEINDLTSLNCGAYPNEMFGCAYEPMDNGFEALAFRACVERNKEDDNGDIE
jgi:hypothetical protein